MRVLFLDFDGVLNSTSYFRRVARETGRQTGAGHIDPLAVERLNRIVKATSCRIVVTSTWRLVHTLEDLQRMLHGLSAEQLLGVTPDRIGPRCREIEKWLDGVSRWNSEQRQWRPPVDQFVILDDDSTAGIGFASHFVQTSPETGLTDDDVDKAIKILVRT